MEQYNVQITDEALKDMTDLYQYILINLQSPENAINQYNRIADEILTLSSLPNRYRLVDFEPERRKGLHRMLVDNFSVFYLVQGQQVIVTDVLYSASDIEQRLNEKHQ